MDFGSKGDRMMSEQPDSEAIITLIEREAAAFWDKDFEAWSQCWLHTPYVRNMGWWARGGISNTEGWENLSAMMKRLMEANPTANATAGNVERRNMNLRIGVDIAWVTFDQYGLDTGDLAMDMPGLSRETRILEKHDGQWKIVYVSWLLVGST